MDATIGNSRHGAALEPPRREGWAYHWDGLNTYLREVVLSSAIGDGAQRSGWTATCASWDDTDPRAMSSLRRVQNYISQLQAPGVSLPVDAALAAQGAADLQGAVRRVPRARRRARRHDRARRGGRDRSASARHVDEGVGRGLQRLRRGARLEVLALPHHSRLRVAAARRPVAARAVPPQRIRALAGRFARAACRRAPRGSGAGTTCSIPCGWDSCPPAPRRSARARCTTRPLRATATPATSTARRLPEATSGRCSSISRPCEHHVDPPSPHARHHAGLSPAAG